MRVWLLHTNALVGAATLIRLTALAAAAWIGLGMLTVLLGRLPGSGRAAARIARRVSRSVPTPVLAAATLLLGSAAACSRAAPAAGPLLPGRSPSDTVTISRSTAGATPATGASGFTGARTFSVRARPAVPPSAGPSSAPEPGWAVAPGESMWSIAVSLLSRPDEPEPDEHAVAALWLRIMSANSQDLVRTGDPSLLMPGQVLVVPPLGT